MIEYRKARPEEKQAYIEFANEVFFPGTDIDFTTLLPKMYGPGIDGTEHHFVAVDPEKGIRGLVGIMPVTLLAGEGGALRAGYIGTVSVHAESRGEGHMKALMKMSIEDMRKNGVDFSLLNGQRQRYEFYGYTPAGATIRYTVAAGNVRHALKDVCVDGVEFRMMTPGSEEERQAKLLHDSRKFRCEREDAPFADYCATYKNISLTVRQNGELIGYIVSDGAEDRLSEIVARSTDDLDRIIKAMIQGKDLKRLSFAMPCWETEMNRHLQNYAESVNVVAECQVKVFNHKKVVGALLAAKAGYSKLADGEMCFDIDGETFGVVVRNGAVEITETVAEPVKLTGFEADRLFFSLLDYEGKPESPLGWFPLPLYISTPDKF